MNHIWLGQRHTLFCALLSVTLLVGAPAFAGEDDQLAGAHAANLESRASELEAKVEKECLKAAVAARPLCRKQLSQAVARLRDNAQRAN